MEKNKNITKKNSTPRRKNIVWTITLSMLSGLVFGLAFLLYSSANTASQHAMSLEGAYQKTHYELSDKVSNIEVKLSKTLSSNNDVYNEKLLNEISKNCEDAQNNLNIFPSDAGGTEEALKFINQLGGYCSTLAQKLGKGQSLTPEEVETLRQLHKSVLEMKKSLSQTTENISKGYTFVGDGLKIKGDYNDITLSIQGMKGQSVEYPTMIYDGPFSDTQIKQEIKGMANLNEESKEVALNKLAELFEVYKEKVEDKGDVTGANFETYNFQFEKEGIVYFAQYSFKGARLLTLSSYNDKPAVNISRDEALQAAQGFISKTEIDSLEVVWSDIVGGDAYFNFAPVISGIIIYPDLVKVKVDLATGRVTGFEAKSYYTNNTDRTLAGFTVSSQEAKAQVANGYAISTTKKALSPVDLEEILCWEFKAIANGNIYYFYVDGQTGQLVNVLRVIQTNQGSKLM